MMGSLGAARAPSARRSFQLGVQCRQTGGEGPLVQRISRRCFEVAVIQNLRRSLLLRLLQNTSTMRFLHLIRPVMCVLPEVASPDRKVSEMIINQHAFVGDHGSTITPRYFRHGSVS